jgi:hypothetical protein
VKGWTTPRLRSTSSPTACRTLVNARAGATTDENVNVALGTFETVVFNNTRGPTSSIKGRLRGKHPKLSPKQEAHLVNLWRAGSHTMAELAELFSVARSTVYRAIQRAGGPIVPASSCPK